MFIASFLIDVAINCWEPSIHLQWCLQPVAIPQYTMALHPDIGSWQKKKQTPCLTKSMRHILVRRACWMVKFGRPLDTAIALYGFLDFDLPGMQYTHGIGKMLWSVCIKRAAGHSVAHQAQQGRSKMQTALPHKIAAAGDEKFFFQQQPRCSARPF